MKERGRWGGVANEKETYVVLVNRKEAWIVLANEKEVCVVLTNDKVIYFLRPKKSHNTSIQIQLLLFLLLLPLNMIEHAHTKLRERLE